MYYRPFSYLDNITNIWYFMPMSWDVRFRGKVVKQIRELPESVQMTVRFLVKDLQINGPVARTWPNFGKLQGQPTATIAI